MAITSEAASRYTFFIKQPQQKFDMVRFDKPRIRATNT
jgi:hypothetical protein